MSPADPRDPTQGDRADLIAGLLGAVPGRVIPGPGPVRLDPDQPAPADLFDNLGPVYAALDGMLDVPDDMDD